MTERVWAFLDQVVSSVTNVLVVVFAARWLAPEQFGTYSLIVGALILTTGIVRTVVIEPFFVNSDTRGLAASVPGAALVLGALLGLVAGLILWLLTSSTDVDQSVLIAVILGAPALATFDSLRMLRIRSHRPRSALALDLVWLAGTVLGLIALAHREVTDARLLTVWVLPPMAISLARTAKHGLNLDTSTRTLWVKNRRLAAGFSTDYLLGVGSQQIAAIALASVLTLSAVGTYRLALTWFGPIGIVYAGLAPMFLAQRLDAAPLTQAERGLLRFSLALGIVAACFTALSILIPQLLNLVLGPEAAASLRPLLLPTGLAFTALGLAAGPILGLRERSQAAGLAIARAGSTPATIGLPLLGGAIAGAAGASWGFAGASIFYLCAVSLLWTFRR